jgi:hypothetical protein
MSRRTLADDIRAAEAAVKIDIIHAGRTIGYHADETGEWWVLSREDLKYAVECRADHGSDAYSHWCSLSGERATEEQARRLGADSWPQS